MNSAADERGQPWCPKHQLEFVLTHGIGGERYIECPKGGWDCPIEWRK